MIYKNIIKKIALLNLLICFSLLLNGCGAYNFTGTGKIDAKTFQVNNFQNNAALVEPGIDRLFTLALQDLIMNQTSLNLTNTGGDLLYEGEITEYQKPPITNGKHHQII